MTTATTMSPIATECAAAPMNASDPLSPTITVGRVALKEALAHVSRASGKSSLPVLSSVLFRATPNGTLILSATDLSLGISVQITATSRDAWAVCIPSKLFTDLVGSFPGDILTIEQVRSDIIRLISGGFETTLHGMEESEFPTLPQVEGTTIAMPGQAFVQAIEAVAPFAASDNDRPTLKGVLIRIKGREASFTAADGFRLAKVTIPLEQEAATEIIIPGDALAEIAPLFKAITGSISVIIPTERNTVVFQAGGTTALTRVIEGKYPDADRIIPAADQYQTRATIKTAELANALKLASYFASSNSQISRASIGPTALILSANAASVGDQRAEVAATCEGQTTQVAFNVKFAAQIMHVVDAATITIAVTSPKHPIVVRPVGPTQAVFILMPMTIQ